MTLKNARIYQELLRRPHHAGESHPRLALARNTLAFARSPETCISERLRHVYGERSAERTWQGRE